MKGIGKYVIGLAVVGLFVLGLVIWLLIQASAVKADNQTYKTASKIAENLENYVSTNSKIPDNLSSVTKETVPGTVTYTKLSEERYKFCVTYKAASSGFDPSTVQTDLLSAAYGLNSEQPYTQDEPSYLYLPSTHGKGENCQTIKPYIYNYGSLNSGSMKSKLDPKCAYPTTSDEQAFKDYYTCMGLDWNFNADDYPQDTPALETL